MLTLTTVLAVLLLILSARAGLTPTGPGPTDVFLAGSQCSISWLPDPTGTWTNVTIQLMSGQNLAMTPVITVVQDLDGTDPTQSPYNWTCPEVQPYSAIYFYEFSQPGSDSPAWTTRFTIASPNGTVDPPEYPTQPSGDATPWGTGQLALSTPSNTTSMNSTLTLPELDGNSTLALPTATPSQSGFVKVVQPTATTVLTWVVLPVSSNGSDTGAADKVALALASDVRELGWSGPLAGAALLAAAGLCIL
ncbi:hypothetical protein CALVIDRAFT_240142 [Calocera viscosa TUFC12733]|uniref:Yeast cell wall synthesis Kre9/Knh1-like N-terminal domain-containing protein n=1 Tax=Calocera viscosa (strain TUFC12733) TaxID=1330018 RepID=A0A167JMG0_CALVF|nr:hypothetical protein CALVIDRAFT_240142 [Calocera viscosa TUFC12733]